MKKSVVLLTYSLLVAGALASCAPSPSIPPAATSTLVRPSATWTSAPPTAPAATVQPAAGSMLEPGDQLGEMVIATGQGENPMIWDYCDPIITEPGPLTLTRECEVPVVPKLFIGYGIVADTAGALDTSWQGITWELTLDGLPVDLPAFGTRDFDSGAKFRLWNIVLEKIPPGEHMLHYTFVDQGLPVDLTWTFTVASPARAIATITPHAAPTAVALPRPVVIDTDMAPDDWMAILYLLQRTDISIQAITIATTGETHCGPSVQHALGLVALANHPPLPVACGRETPLKGNHTFPQDWRASVDTLMGTDLTLPEGKNPFSGKNALELLTSTIQSSPEEVTLLVLGPHTNLAELLQSVPSVAKRIEMVYVMGGAVHVPGNLGAIQSENRVAEWNFYVDPHAAKIVFESEVPITLVPLDATNQVKITDDFYQLLQASRLTLEASWIYDLFTKGRGYFLSGDNYFWDPLAAAVLTDESLATYEEDTLCVVEEEGPLSGQTEIAAGCPTMRVAVSADGARFERTFLDTLNNP